MAREPVVIDKPFLATHRLKHRETGAACDELMRVETPHGERFYTEASWVYGGHCIERNMLPSFDIESLGESN